MFKNSRYSSKRFNPIKIFFFIGVFIAFLIGMSWLVMFLWNTILVDAAGVKPLNFWKAAGLLLLAKILLGGFKRPKRPWNNSNPRYWKDKWLEMNSEEREQVKSRWQKYCEYKHFKREEE